VLPSGNFRTLETAVLDTTTNKVLLIAGDAIARYGFPGGHPFGTDRHEVFMTELKGAGIEDCLLHATPCKAAEELQLFTLRIH
jgi:acetoin utilization protein AcuC